MGMNDINEYDLFNKYVREIRNYKILTPEEEKIYGKDLLIKKDIKIFQDNSIARKLDIRKLLSSIKTKEEKDYIFEKLNNDYLIECNNSQQKDILQIMNKYNELCEVLDDIPSSKEFNTYIGYNTSTNKVENPIEQIDLYCKFNKARNIFIKSNLRLAVSYAAKFRKVAKELNINDVTNAANIGLIKAVDTFDVTKDFKFSTYAFHSIKKDVLIEIYKTDRAIRLPSYIYQIQYKCEKARSEHAENSSEELDLKKLSELTDTPVRQLKVLNEIHDIISYNQMVSKSSNDEHETEMVELIDDNGYGEFTATVEQDYLHESVNDIMDKILTPREKYIISTYYGLNDYEKKSLAAIGKELNTSGERVRQVKAKTLQKLKQYDNKHGKRLKDCYNDEN